MCQAVVVSLLMVTLFLSRAVYNFITITPNIRNKLPGFGYDWINVSDQVCSLSCVMFAVFKCSTKKPFYFLYTFLPLY